MIPMHAITQALLLAAATLFPLVLSAAPALQVAAAPETVPASVAQTTPVAGPALHSVLMLGVGYGQFENPLHQGEDTVLRLLPRWQLYYGNVYAENLDLGVNLYQQGAFALDLTTKQSLDALLVRRQGLKPALLRGLLGSKLPLPSPFGVSLDTMLTPQQRHFSYLAGLTAYYQSGHWQLKSALHQDISKVHHGLEWLNEISVQQQFSNGLGVQLGLGWRQLSSDYSNYYFAVKPEDTSNQLYQYNPGQAGIRYFKLAAGATLTPQLQLVWNWKREFLPDSYQHNYFFRTRVQDTWFTGFFYQF